MVIANPIPHEHALDKALIDGAIARAVAEMDEKGIGGKLQRRSCWPKLPKLPKVTA